MIFVLKSYKFPASPYFSEMEKTLSAENFYPATQKSSSV